MNLPQSPVSIYCTLHDFIVKELIIRCRSRYVTSGDLASCQGSGLVHDAVRASLMCSTGAIGFFFLSKVHIHKLVCIIMCYLHYIK